MKEYLLQIRPVAKPVQQTATGQGLLKVFSKVEIPVQMFKTNKWGQTILVEIEKRTTKAIGVCQQEMSNVLQDPSTGQCYDVSALV